jgi:hypothetical protein
MRWLLASTFLAAFAAIAEAQSGAALPSLDCVMDCAIQPPPPVRIVGLEPPSIRRPPGGSHHDGAARSPFVWVIDSRAFCPDSNPATWRNEPRGAPQLDEKTIDSVEVTKDSSILRSYRCSITPVAAIVIRTKRRD